MQFIAPATHLYLTAISLGLRSSNRRNVVGSYIHVGEVTYVIPSLTSLTSSLMVPALLALNDSRVVGVYWPEFRQGLGK